jgi:hydroxymethylglutaryl-CoA reductase
MPPLPSDQHRGHRGDLVADRARHHRDVLGVQRHVAALDAGGDLSASIELPMAVGLVGGATKLHPTAQACLKILGAASIARVSLPVASTTASMPFMIPLLWVAAR